jgi:hypothetical protein
LKERLDICVASSEEDVFTDLASFRSKLAVAVGIFFIVGVVLSTLGARASATHIRRNCFSGSPNQI